MNNVDPDKKDKGRFFAAASLFFLIWFISLVQLSGITLNLIPMLLPRTLSGLPGILTMPFLHGNMAHLLSNTLPLIVFSVLISLKGNAYFIKVTVLVIIISGIALWLFGRSSYHIGASGLIFGYFGFLLVRMFYSPSIASITISMGVLIFYGGIIFGVLPQGGGVSWEGHLFGFLSGIGVAKIMKVKETD